MKRYFTLAAALFFAVLSPAVAADTQTQTISQFGYLSALNGAVTLPYILGRDSCHVTIAPATGTLTVTFEGYYSAGWNAVSLVGASGAASTASPTSSVQSFVGLAAPSGQTATAFRVRVSAYTSGTIAVALQCFPSSENGAFVLPPAFTPSGSGSGGGAVTMSQSASTVIGGVVQRDSAGSDATNTSLHAVNTAILGTLPAFAAAPTVVPQAATYTLLTASGNTVVKASAGIIYGVYSLSPSTQTVGVTCYDNATTNTGNLFVNFVSPAFMGPGQYVSFNPGGGSGIAAVNGITCNLTGALTATTAIGVLWK